MWTCINLQHKKPEKIFGYVLEYYGVFGQKRLGWEGSIGKKRLPRKKQSLI
jgi:hypothetical protein